MSTKQSGGGFKWLVGISAIIVAVAGGLWHVHNGGNDAPQYQFAPVARANLTQTVTATGSLNPVVNVTVGSQVSGIINRLYVDFNSVVTSNEVIAEIDPSTYQAALSQARADLANARANLELQQVEYRRSADLFTNKLISGSDYDTAAANLHEAEAMVQIKDAVVSNATVNLGYCKIRSPVDGVVISRAVELGQTVASSFNTPTIFQIANDLTKMQIDTAVAEADVGGIVEGQEVEFSVDAYPYRAFYGTVVQVRNAPTNSANVISYDCVVSVTNSDYKLKPGMTANCSFIIAERENVLTLPVGALRFRPPDNAVVLTNSAPAPTPQAAGAGNSAGGTGARHGGRHGEPPVFHTVYMLAGSGASARLQPVPIRTGISDGISTEVLSGLDAGAPVVTGVVAASAQTQSSSGRNPFGGGFPRPR